jgi:hypothetical protein
MEREGIWEEAENLVKLNSIVNGFTIVSGTHEHPLVLYSPKEQINESTKLNITVVGTVDHGQVITKKVNQSMYYGSHFTIGLEKGTRWRFNCYNTVLWTIAPTKEEMFLVDNWLIKHHYSNKPNHKMLSGMVGNIPINESKQHNFLGQPVFKQKFSEPWEDQKGGVPAIRVIPTGQVYIGTSRIEYDEIKRKIQNVKKIEIGFVKRGVFYKTVAKKEKLPGWALGVASTQPDNFTKGNQNLKYV